MSNQIIYYVGSRLSPESSLGLASHFGLAASSKFHSTLAFSRSWFTYKDDKPYPVIVDPPFQLAKFGSQLVILLRSPELALRWQELRASGASWDFPDFQLHITLGRASEVPKRSCPAWPLVFDKEYYGTWRE